MLQLVSLNGRWRDALAVTVIAGFGISGIVGPLELEREASLHQYKLQNGIFEHVDGLRMIRMWLTECLMQDWNYISSTGGVRCVKDVFYFPPCWCWTWRRLQLSGGWSVIICEVGWFDPRLFLFTSQDVLEKQDSPKLFPKCKLFWLEASAQMSVLQRLSPPT